VISLSEDSLPKVIRTVIKTAIGIANEIIQAELKIKNLKTISNDNPLPKNLSIFFKTKFDNKTKTRINKELTNGVNNSLKIYLLRILNNWDLLINH
tara:strand:- start:1281 stop:1568 length:288 start_codon:yes stop_codon:yes gene_type:complete